MNTLWALTVFDVVDDELLAALLQRAQALPLKFEELCQMHQLLLHVRLHADRLPVTRYCGGLGSWGGHGWGRLRAYASFWGSATPFVPIAPPPPLCNALPASHTLVS